MEIVLNTGWLRRQDVLRFLKRNGLNGMVLDVYVKLQTHFINIEMDIDSKFKQCNFTGPFLFSNQEHLGLLQIIRSVQNDFQHISFGIKYLSIN